VGTHTVVETDPAGYLSTTPNQVAVKVVAMDRLYVVNFGDALVQDCCTQDAYEEDDVAGQAKALGIEEVQDRTFCDDATDWLAVTVKAGNIYTITTSSWGRRADTIVTLFDADASTMLAANDDYEGTTDFSSRLIWQATRDGVYYVRITNRAGLSGCATDYRVWVERLEQTLIYLPIVLYSRGSMSVSESSPTIEGTIAPAGVIDHSCPDAYELDDTWQQAKDIEPGTAQVHSFDSDPTYYAADKDFVWFELQSSQTITFTATPVVGSATLLELYDSSGIALGKTASTQLVWEAPSAGRYYLSVSPQTNAFGCASDAGYNLLAEIEPLQLLYLPVVVRQLVP
jgi:hypothetical protein